MWLLPLLLWSCASARGDKFRRGYVWRPVDHSDDKDAWSTYDKFGSADPQVWKSSYPKETHWRPDDDYILEYDPKEVWKDRPTTTTPPPPAPDDWKYQADEDPAMWSCLYKDCRGHRQSPINIDTEVIRLNKSLPKFTFHNYKKPLKDLSIENTGHSVEIEIPDDARVKVEDSRGVKYRLIRIEMYWSNSSFKGSQHSVDSKHFPLEMVLIHLNTKYDKPVNKHDAGLALSVLFQIKKDDNEKLNGLFDGLHKIKFAGEDDTLSSPLRVRDLIPRNPFSYISYFGSLLHPPCYQAVTWIVFRHSNSLSENQLVKLRHLRSTSKDEKPEVFITKTSRPIQDLNDRKIKSTLPSYRHVNYQFDPSVYEW